MIRKKILLIIFIFLILILIPLTQYIIQQRTNTTGHAATLPNTPIIETPSHAGFPTIALNFKYATDVDPKDLSYQMADFDANHNRVFFYPYGISNHGDPYGTPSGTLLAYDTTQDFTNSSSYSSYNLPQILNNPQLGGFGGGFMDDQGNYLYMAGQFGADPVTSILASNGWAVQVDLNAPDLTSPNAYKTFNIANLVSSVTGKPIKYVGWWSGVSLNGRAYFTPSVDPGKGPWHGNFVQYDSSVGTFDNAAAWKFFDLQQAFGSAAGGMQSATVKFPWIYLIPFTNGGLVNSVGASLLVRYNTTQDFQTASSYQTYDLEGLASMLQTHYPSMPAAQVTAELTGFTGGLVVGNKVIFIPWRDNDDSIPSDQQSNSVALMYDATDPNSSLADTNLWQTIDLKTVDPSAAGYQFGWVDKNGLVWFVPTSNRALSSNGTFGVTPPIIVWNSALPFSDPTSWASYPSPKNVWYSGAAYNPTTNTAWFSPYGGNPNVPPPEAQILQLQEDANSATATIEVNPATSITLNQGTTFGVSILVNGQGQSFNSAAATVTVSSNLQIISVNSSPSPPAPLTSCNLVYTTLPTISDVSFAGTLPSPSSSCMAYIIGLKAIGTGPASIMITNGSVTRASDNVQIFSSSIDGSYTVGSGQPAQFSFPHIYLDGIGSAGDHVYPFPPTPALPAPLTPTFTPTPTLATPNRTLLVELFKNENDTIPLYTVAGQVSYQPTTGDFGGTIQWNNAVAGQYYMRVVFPRYLRQGVPNQQTVALNTTLTLPTVVLTVGDVDADNQLTIADYNIISACGDFSFLPGYPMLDSRSQYASSPTCQTYRSQLAATQPLPGLLQGDAGYADLDGNGYINFFDLTLFQRDYTVQ